MIVKEEAQLLYQCARAEYLNQRDARAAQQHFCDILSITFVIHSPRFVFVLTACTPAQFGALSAVKKRLGRVGAAVVQARTRRTLWSAAYLRKPSSTSLADAQTISANVLMYPLSNPAWLLASHTRELIPRSSLTSRCLLSRCSCKCMLAYPLIASPHSRGYHTAQRGSA
jgi:hypothetical protein